MPVPAGALWICAMRTETWPPGGVNFTALEMRLSKIWLRRILSQ